MNKQKTRKKVVAFLLSMLMLISLFQNISYTPIAEGGESGSDSLNVSVGIQKEGSSTVTPISNVTSIKDGDKVNINFDMSMVDGTKTNPYSFEVDLNPKSNNVSIPDSTAPYEVFDAETRQVIGTAKVVNNKIIVEITDSPFLENKTGRHASGSIDGVIKNIGAPIESGTTVPFQIGTYVNTTLTWDNGEPESNLNVSKTAVNNVTYDSATGKYTQEFKITIEAKNGKCTLDSIEDIMGSYLQLNGGYKVTSSTVASISSGSVYSDISELNNTVLSENEKIELIYTTTVSEEATSRPAGDKIKNTVSGTWTNNKKVSGKAFRAEANASVKTPSLTKTLDSGATDDKQTWTITIDLGDYGKSGKTLDDYLGTGGYIHEIPGTGLTGNVDSGQNYKDIKASDFTSTDGIVYTCKYDTALTEEYKQQESTTVKNKVETKTENYGELNSEAGYTTTGVPGASIEKNYKQNSYDQTTGSIGWKVTIKGLSKNATKVKILDTTGNTYNAGSLGIVTTGKTLKDNNHLLNKTIKINGKKVIDNGVITADGNGVIRTSNDWGGPVDYSLEGGKTYTIYLLDSFVSNNNGADIVIEYETTIADLNESRKNVLYYNEADLSYKDATNTEKTIKAGAVFEDTDASNQRANIQKTGVANDESLTINYTIQTALESFDATKDSPVIIKDKLPAGLRLVGTPVVTDYLGTETFASKVYIKYDPATQKRVWYTANPEAYSLNDCTSTIVTSGDTNEITFTVSNKWSKIKKFMDAGGNVDLAGAKVSFKITYTAEVVDKAAYNKAGQEQTFENKAQGFFDNSPIGDSVTCTTKLKPNALVKKSATVIQDNSIVINVGGHDVKYSGVKYSVDVNPDAIDLTEGKLTGVDELGKQLSYYLPSVEVYQVNASGIETALSYGTGENQYSYVYDAKNNKITFALPDSMHLRIKYTALANAYMDKDTEGSYTASNKFSLSGVTGTNTSATDTRSAVIDKAAFMGGSGTGSINIKKYWNNNGIVAVVGSKFKVYKPNQTNLTYTEADVLKDSSGNAYIYEVTNTDGTVSISNLLYNTIYALVEVEGGYDVSANRVPMSVKTEPYYFMLAGKGYDAVSIPEGVRTFGSAGILEFKNEKDQSGRGTIEVTKTISGLTSQTDIDKALTNLKFEITKDGETTPTYTITAAADATYKLVKDGTGYKCTITNVPVGKYKVKETVTSIDGYRVSKDYTVTGTTGNDDSSGVEFDVIDNNTSILTYRNTYSATSIDVKFSKKEIVGNNELPGAMLTLYKKDAGGSWITEPAWSWTSGTSEKTFALEDGDYKLEEKSAPQGYIKANDIEFKITAGTLTGNTVSVDSTNKRVTMVDKQFEVKVSKQDLSGVALTGATISIYRENDVNSDGTIKTGAAELDRWTSVAGQNYDFGAKLQTGETYVLIETDSPDGYGYSKNVTFKIKADGTIEGVTGKVDANAIVTSGHASDNVVENSIIMKDRATTGTIELTKSLGILPSGLDVTTVLANLKFEITRVGNVSPAYIVEGTSLTASVVGGNTVYTWKQTDVPTGNYTVTEILTNIPDYAVSTTYIVGSTTGTVASNTPEFTVMDSQTCKLEYSNTYSSGTTVKVSKTALTGTTELSGAILAIYKGTRDADVQEGNKVTEWETTSVMRAVSLSAGDYILVEKVAPEGYSKAENILFSVSADGKVTVAGNVQGNKTIHMSDEPIKDIRISKVSLTGNTTTSLAGAHLELYEGNYVKNSPTNKLVEAWNSDATEHIINGSRLKIDQLYSLVETSAPAGFNVASVITFKLDKKGSITDVTNAYNSSDPANRLIVMLDKATSKFVISKKTVGESGELVGAFLELYAGESVTGTPIASWTTGITAQEVELGTTNKQVNGNITVKQNALYTLREKIAPYGYELADAITFKVDADGRLFTKNFTTGLYDVPVTGSGIVMRDVKKTISISKVDATNSEKLDGAKLKITDASGTEVVSWVTLKQEGAKQLDVLQFQPDTEYVLTEVSAPTGYKLADAITFKVGSDNVLYVKKNDGSFTMVDSREIVMKDEKEEITTSEETTTEKITTQETTTTEETTTQTSVTTELTTSETQIVTTTTTTTTTTSSNTSKKTGDTAPVAPITVVMLVAAVGIIILGVVKKKRNDK